MLKLFKTPFFFRYVFNRREWGFSESSSVFLTFDDGPTESLTEWILDYLKAENIQATFFCVGENGKRLPKLLDRIKADGHSIGNHTMSHEKGLECSKEEYLNSIEKANQHIKSNLFRPPYGRMSRKLDKILSKEYRIIMWSWLSYDYDHSVPVERILLKARKQIKAGDIIVLHDNLKVKDRLKDILPELVKIIREKNLTFKVIK